MSRLAPRPLRHWWDGSWLCVIVVLAASIIGGCGSSPVVARVGDNPVYEAEEQHWAALVARAIGGSTGAVGVRARTLSFLLLSRRIVAQAHALGVSVSPAQTAQRLEFLRFQQVHRGEGELQAGFAPLPRDSLFRSLLLSQNVEGPDARWLMQLNLLAARVEAALAARAAGELPREKVARYYATHRERYVEPAVRDLELIGNEDEAIVWRARREIEGGKPFLEVARRASNDPEGPHGLQHLIRGTEEPPYERHIFGAKLHVLVGPIKQELYYMFEVLSAKPDRQKRLPEVEAEVRRQLSPRRVETVLLPAAEAAWVARTNCRPGHVVQGCSEYGVGTRFGFYPKHLVT